MSTPEFDNENYPFISTTILFPELLGPGPLSQFELRSQMRLQDPMDAYRPLNEQTSNAPYWDAFK